MPKPSPRCRVVPEAVKQLFALVPLNDQMSYALCSAAIGRYDAGALATC
jgi:hypothetical protein